MTFGAKPRAYCDLLPTARHIIHNPSMSSSMPDPDPQQRLTIDQGRSARRRAWLAAAAAALVAAVVIVIIARLVATHKTSKIAVPREAFNLLTQRFWAVLGFAVGIGVASAAVIQLAKQLFRVRSRFQQRWVMDWIGDRCAIEPLWADWLEQHPKIEGNSSASPDAAPTSVAASSLAASQRKLAEEELQEALLGGRAEYALRDVFDLPIEQLCAQISSAADLAITEPERNAELLLGLTGPTGLKDIDQLAPAKRIVDGRIEREPSKEKPAYPQVAQGVRTGIDVMQISVGQRWRRGVQGSAVLISGILGVIGVFFARVAWPTRGLFILAALVFGGFFAWLIRDLTAIVERIRG